MSSKEEGLYLLDGAVDMHAHTSPSLFPRRLGDMELARMAKEHGMRGFVLKDHDQGTAGRAEVIRGEVSDIVAVGGLVLNRSVGGLDPHIVEANLLYGAKVIWFPTTDSQAHLDHFGIGDYPQQVRQPRKFAPMPLLIIDENGALTSEARTVLELALYYDACIATGHITLSETFAVLRVAREIGLERVVVTHGNWAAWRYDPVVQQQLADKGAYLEYVALACVAPGFIEQDPAELAWWVKEVGAERVVLSSDLGQAKSAPHPYGLGSLIGSLLDAGVSQGEVIRMVKTNPCALLDLK